MSVAVLAIIAQEAVRGSALSLLPLQVRTISSHLHHGGQQPLGITSLGCVFRACGWSAGSQARGVCLCLCRGRPTWLPMTLKALLGAAQAQGSSSLLPPSQDGGHSQSRRRPRGWTLERRAPSQAPSSKAAKQGMLAVLIQLPYLCKWGRCGATVAAKAPPPPAAAGAAFCRRGWHMRCQQITQRRGPPAAMLWALVNGTGLLDLQHPESIWLAQDMQAVDTSGQAEA